MHASVETCVRPRNPWYCGCSGDKGGGNKDPRSRRTDSTRLRLPRPSDASLDQHPVQHNPDPLKMFQRAQKRADCVIIGSLFHTTPRAQTGNLTSHQNKWFGTWLRILPPQWVRHRSYQSISASQRREGYITIKIISITNKAIDYTIDFKIFSKQQLRYRVTFTIRL